MTNEELVARFKSGKTSACVECGRESTLWFGFASPCRYNGGSHQRFVEVDTTSGHEAAKVWAAYHGGMYYDRQRFEQSTSPLASLAKKLLRDLEEKG